MAIESKANEWREANLSFPKLMINVKYLDIALFINDTQAMTLHIGEKSPYRVGDIFSVNSEDLYEYYQDYNDPLTLQNVT